MEASSETFDEPLWQTVRRDFAGTTGLRLLGVAGLVAWMAFQWGFGNDALLPPIIASTFEGLDDGSTWDSGAVAVAAAAAAGFGFWALSQALDAIITLAGLKLVPHTIARASAFLRRKGWVKPYADMSWSTRWIIAYATGVSALCLVDLLATGTNGITNRRTMIVTGTMLSAGSVGVVSGLVATAAMVAKRVPATASGAETFIRYARNPLTWILIFSAVFLVGYLRGSSEQTTQSPDV